MIRSMTGFGEASTQVDGAHYAVEIRSLNNRYLKAQVRLPEELQGLEAELEAALSKRVTRGSVVIAVRYQNFTADAAARINVPVVQRYVGELLGIDGVSRDTARIDLAALLALPGALVTGTDDARLGAARAILLDLVEQAADRLVGMREREGGVVRGDLHHHCRLIADHLTVIAERAPIVVDLYQAKLRQRMETLLAESGAAVRDEDLLREVAVFAERSDIAEEIARLQGHLDQFAEIIDADDREEPSGRTLDFIAQEMLREANTIASKCLDVDVSRRIVEVKGAIDRIKEQVQNVE